MTVKYLKFGLSIHGLNAENDRVVEYLKDNLKKATLSILNGTMKNDFNFRDEFSNDIEIELEEHAGRFTETQ